MIEFTKAVEMIEENRKKFSSFLENLISTNITKIESLVTLKSNLVQQLDQLIDSTKSWILNLQSTGSKCSEYSFFEELDLIIANQKQNNNNENNLSIHIKKLNDSWNTKVHSKLEKFKSFQIYQDCNYILNNLTQQFQQFSQNNILQSQQNLNSIKLQFIEDSVGQKEKCNSIVFDPTGKIMVSTIGRDIKIWDFNNGRIKQNQFLQGHQDVVNCLVFSQTQKCFFSGSEDKSIRMWKYGFGFGPNYKLSQQSHFKGFSLTRKLYYEEQ